MAKSTWLEELTSTPEDMREFQQEKVILDTTELISRLMDVQRVSKTELASRLGKTKGYITQLLDGRTNMTLRTISDVLFALGRSLSVSDRPIRVTDSWSENPSGFSVDGLPNAENAVDLEMPDTECNVRVAPLTPSFTDYKGRNAA
jgi:hypothetical protein